MAKVFRPKTLTWVSGTVDLDTSYCRQAEKRITIPAIVSGPFAVHRPYHEDWDYDKKCWREGTPKRRRKFVSWNLTHRKTGLAFKAGFRTQALAKRAAEILWKECPEVCDKDTAKEVCKDFPKRLIQWLRQLGDKDIRPMTQKKWDKEHPTTSVPRFHNSHPNYRGN